MSSEQNEVNIDLNDGHWVRVTCGHTALVGRVVPGEPHRALLTQYNDPIRESVLAAMAEHKAVVLNPCCELFNDIDWSMTPSGPVSRRLPAIFPFDLTSAWAPVYVLVSTVVFFTDLKEEDRDVYKKAVSHALTIGQKEFDRRRTNGPIQERPVASPPRIVLANTLPPTTPGGHFGMGD